LKILFISSGNASSGISSIVKKQGESLIKSGVDLEFFTIKGKGLFSYLKHIFILHKHLKNNIYDLVHAHYSYSAYVASLAGCKPLVVSLMGSDMVSGLLGKLLIDLFSFLSWNKVIVKSLSMLKTSGLKRALIIPNGVDIDTIETLEKDSHIFKELSSIKAHNKTILFASDPERISKNFNLAQKSIAKINCDLRVVYNKLHEEIINEIIQADVLLLTSLWEGSPNIVKEAMACNCPVVATDVGDVCWLFGDEPGHFLTSFDPQDVADKIKQALQFSEKYGRTNGRQRIIKLGLDADTVANKIIGVYQEVLEKRKIGRRGKVKE